MTSSLSEKERFWKSVRDTYDDVQKWPGWKRGVPMSESELQRHQELLNEEKKEDDTE